MSAISMLFRRSLQTVASKKLPSKKVFPVQTQRVLDELDASNPNRRSRIELAAAYRGLDMYGLGEGVCNHLTTLAPAQNNPNDRVMLVSSFGLHWSEVTASNLVGLNDKNEVVEGEGEPQNAAICIHRGIYNARPDVTTIMHAHMPYTTALALSKSSSLRYLHQNTLKFHNKVAYDLDFNGLAEVEDEGKRLGRILGDKQIMMMGNHGVLVVADSIHKAFDLTYYVERSAMYQVLAESTGRELNDLPEKAMQKFFSELEDGYWEKFEVAHFCSLIRRLQRLQPDFQH
ncbi:Uncharacterised protein g1251 [Pycnogonum litorale]